MIAKVYLLWLEILAGGAPPGHHRGALIVVSARVGFFRVAPLQARVRGLDVR